MNRGAAAAVVVLVATACNRSSATSSATSSASATPSASTPLGAIAIPAAIAIPGASATPGALPTAGASATPGALAPSGASGTPGASATTGGSASPGASASATATAIANLTSPSAKVVRAKSIGHTSVVFKLGFDDGTEAAYKPRSKPGGERFEGEIAAYRLARALDLDAVPPAFARSIPLAELRATGVDVSLVVPETDGTVRGALIPWIVGLELPPLDKDRPRWEPWLTGATRAEDPRLAREIAIVVLFDFVTGNWDRWSGGNVGRDPKSGSLLYVDNDGAFFEPLPEKPFAVERGLFAAMHRFPRAFVAHLRALEDAAFDAALAHDAADAPLLDAAQVRAAAARRRQVLATVDAVVARDGGAFAFP